MDDLNNLQIFLTGVGHTCENSKISNKNEYFLPLPQPSCLSVVVLEISVCVKHKKNGRAGKAEGGRKARRRRRVKEEVRQKN